VLPDAVGAGGEGFTVIVIDAQLGLNTPPLLLFTKYVVVTIGDNVIVAPVPTWDPPQEPVNQYVVPIAPFAVKVTDCPAQIVVELAVILVGGVTPPAQFVERYPKVLVAIAPHCGEQQLPTLK
jgi:hypothetical protein